MVDDELEKVAESINQIEAKVGAVLPRYGSADVLPYCHIGTTVTSKTWG